jgi:hypothetical protein
MATIPNQNGRHMVQHVLLPVNIHFHWNLFIFEFSTIYFDFILAAILKILKTKSTTLSDDLFLCQVSKGSVVRSEFNIFYTLVTMATAAILNLFNPQKLPHTAVDIPTKFHEVWWKESKILLNPPFFVSMATVAKFIQPIPIFLAYDIPTRFHKVWSRHLREIERTKMCGRIRIIRIVKKKRRITIHHPTAAGVT